RLRTFQVRALGQLGDLSVNQEQPSRFAPTAAPEAQGWWIRSSGASPSSLILSSGEGGIRTHEAFAYRFSRAAPSTTRTPLRTQSKLSNAREALPVGVRGGRHGCPDTSAGDKRQGEEDRRLRGRSRNHPRGRDGPTR